MLVGLFGCAGSKSADCTSWGDQREDVSVPRADYDAALDQGALSDANCADLCSSYATQATVAEVTSCQDLTDATDPSAEATLDCAYTPGQVCP